MTHAEKVALLKSTYGMSAEAQLNRSQFIASRAEVINPVLYEESTIRQIFRPETLAPGASLMYEIPHEDVECAWLMPQIGAIPSVQMEAKEVSVPVFEIAGGVEYQWNVARDGNVVRMESATRKLMESIKEQEEEAGWALIRAHAAALPASQIVRAFNDEGDNSASVPAADRKLNTYTFSELITVADELGIGGRMVTDIYATPRRLADIRNAINSANLPEDLREDAWRMNTRQAQSGVETNISGGIRLHPVYNRNLIDNDTAYAFTQKDGYFYGAMPIVEEIETWENPISQLERKTGMFANERIGLAVLDDKGLIAINFK